MNTLVKIFTDFVPLLAFFLSYKLYGRITATTVLLITSVVGVIVHYIHHKKLPTVLIISTVIVVILGSFAIFSGDSRFVKIKPTVVSLIFALILFYGTYVKKGYMKPLLSASISLSEKDWIVLSKRFALFFLCIAILNELIWRNLAENIWVNFKVFGILCMTIVFIVSQISFLYKNQLK